MPSTSPLRPDTSPVVPGRRRQIDAHRVRHVRGPTAEYADGGERGGVVERGLAQSGEKSSGIELTTYEYEDGERAPPDESVTSLSAVVPAIMETPKST